MDDYHLKPKRIYNTIWFRLPSGKVQSYRFKTEQARARIEEMKQKGAVVLEDPFRKGAPIGGYKV